MNMNECCTSNKQSARCQGGIHQTTCSIMSSTVYWTGNSDDIWHIWHWSYPGSLSHPGLAYYQMLCKASCIFRCDQAALWMVFTVRLSACPSVCIITKFSGVITKDQGKVHAKGQGQRSKFKVTYVTTQINRFRTVTPVWIHTWWWNHTYSLMLHRRDALLFLAATMQLYEWYFLSVWSSVCLSVCLSHIFDYISIIVSSWNLQELSQRTRVRSMQKVKVGDQKSRSHGSQPNLTVSGL